MMNQSNAGNKCGMFLLVVSILLLIPAAKLHAFVAESRPDPAGVPTQVAIGIYVIDISRISAGEQTFTADFALRMQWQDPRLKKGHIYKLQNVWYPDFLILNQQGFTRFFDEVVRVDSAGIVRYRQRFFGELSLTLGLRDFPFDKHPLPITLVSVSNSPQEVVFELDEYGTGRADEMSIADWSISREFTGQAGAYYLAPQDIELSRFDFTLEARRHAGFYIWRVVVPLLLIIFMSWTVFYVDPSKFEAQTTISVTAMLTVVAFEFTLGSLLPHISYLTRLDKFIQGGTVLIFLALIESVTTSMLTSNGKHDLAKKVDRRSRIIFPIALVALTIFSFLI